MWDVTYLKFIPIFILILTNCAVKQLTPEEKIIQRANTIRVVSTTSIRTALYLVNRYIPDFVTAIESDVIFTTKQLDAVSAQEIVNGELVGLLIADLGNRINARLHQLPQSDVKEIGNLIKDIGKLVDQYLISTVNIIEFKVYIESLTI